MCVCVNLLVFIFGTRKKQLSYCPTSLSCNLPGVRKIRCFTQNSTAKLISCLSSKMEQLKILGVPEVPEAWGGHSLEIPSKLNSGPFSLSQDSLLTSLSTRGDAKWGRVSMQWTRVHLFLKWQKVNGSGSVGLMVSAPQLLSLLWRATPAFDFTPTDKGAGVPTERCFGRRDLTHGQSLLTSALEKRRLMQSMNLQSPDLLWFWCLVYKTE